jgi:hypothetical protein
MKRTFLVSVLCLFALLLNLGSCGNPNNPSVQENPANQEKPDEKDPPGEPSNPDQPDPDNPSDPDGEDNPDDPNSPSDPGKPDGPDGPDSPDEPNEPVPVALTGAKALQDYLAAQPENAETAPYLVKLGGINLASDATGDTLKGLYDALSRYVALDLSDCTGENFASITKGTAPNKTKITEIILPRELSTINTNAFVDCAALVAIDMPGVTTIMQGAFNGCKKLEIVLMEEVRAIKNTPSGGNAAFDQCDALKWVSLPNATEIGQKTFNSCDVLSTVYLPKATVIGDSAFAVCKKLESITFGATPPELGDAVFAANMPGAIYVPASAVSTYKSTATKGWTDALKAKVQAQP